MKLSGSLKRVAIKPISAYVTGGTAPCNSLHPIFPSGHFLSKTRFVHHSTSASDIDALLPCSLEYGYRPIKEHAPRKVDPAYRAYYRDVIQADFQELYRNDLETKMTDWWYQCKERFTGQPHGLGVETCMRYWSIARFGIMAAMFNGMDPKDDADARLICARARTAGFPRFYHNIHQQADALYLLGRIELERDPKFHRFAWYVLNLATELGQLDAALLLCRLERADSSLVAGTKARSLIYNVSATRADDWRAIMLYAEMEVLCKTEARRSLQSTSLAFHLLRALVQEGIPAYKVTAGPDLQPLAHPDALEEYPPPCRYFWKVVKAGGDKLRSHLISEGSVDDQYWDEYAAAMHEDAIRYHNPEAMYEVAKLSPDFAYMECRRGSNRRRRMLRKASLTVPGASYILSKEICKQTSLIPTRKAMERKANHAPTVSKYLPVSIAQANGIKQTISTAELYHGKNSTAEAYLYLLAAGLFHDNGMFDEGRLTIEIAIIQVQKTIDILKEDQPMWNKLFSGLLHRWDSYKAAGFYAGIRPEDVIEELDRIIINEGGEG